MAMGAMSLRLPGLVANMFPTSSTSTVQPSFSHSDLNQSRTRLSSSDTVRRLMPPLGVPPNWAVSISVSHRRCGLMVRLVFDAGAVMAKAIQTFERSGQEAGPGGPGLSSAVSAAAVYMRGLTLATCGACSARSAGPSRSATVLHWCQ